MTPNPPPTCEPPEGTADNTFHWLHDADYGYLVAKWWAPQRKVECGWWLYAGCEMEESPDEAAKSGLVYIGPAYPPSATDG
jgi:hypothetical protein